MSQENVEIVERAWRAFERGDVAVAFGDLAEDFVATRVPPMPDVVPYYGAEGMMMLLSDWIEDFSEFNMTAEEFIDTGGAWVVARVHQRAVGAKSGVSIESDFWMVHTMRDRKWTRMDIYGSASQALRAVGLKE